MGYFIEDNLIVAKMVYDHFSYDIEKAWCNKDVQRIVKEARAADKSTTANVDPIYGNFESWRRSTSPKSTKPAKTWKPNNGSPLRH